MPYFNPRPLAGATTKNHYHNCHCNISIHAPLRGRRIAHGLSLVGEISIHAPLRGRRLVPFLISPPHLFQSTPPCGGDTGELESHYHTPISIHAPLRGRLSAVFLNATMLIFQSTPPCGGDRNARTASRNLEDFNPRPLAGATTLRSLEG